MEKYIALFGKIGIPEKTGYIYLDLLHHGNSSIAEICQRSRLHRPEVYRALPFLIEEKLVQKTIQGKRSFFRALSPERIELMIRDFEKRNIPIVDELKQKYENLKKNISVSHQSGRSGITSVFDDIVDSLPKHAIFYRISAENDVHKSNTYLPKDYREKRDKKGLERYVIMGSKAAQSKNPRLERELVIIPEHIDEFHQDVTMTIYGNKVAYIDFSSESAIIIENPLIAEFQKKLFMLTYKNLRK